MICFALISICAKCKHNQFPSQKWINYSLDINDWCLLLELHQDSTAKIIDVYYGERSFKWYIENEKYLVIKNTPLEIIQFDETNLIMKNRDQDTIYFKNYDHHKANFSFSPTEKLSDVELDKLLVGHLWELETLYPKDYESEYYNRFYFTTDTTLVVWSIDNKNLISSKSWGTYKKEDICVLEMIDLYDLNIFINTISTNQDTIKGKTIVQKDLYELQLSKVQSISQKDLANLNHQLSRKWKLVSELPEEANQEMYKRHVKIPVSLTLTANDSVNILFHNNKHFNTTWKLDKTGKIIWLKDDIETQKLLLIESLRNDSLVINKDIWGLGLQEFIFIASD